MFNKKLTLAPTCFFLVLKLWLLRVITENVVFSASRTSVHSIYKLEHLLLGFVQVCIRVCFISWGLLLETCGFWGSDGPFDRGMPRGFQRNERHGTGKPWRELVSSFLLPSPAVFLGTPCTCVVPLRLKGLLETDTQDCTWFEGLNWLIF